MVDVTISQLYTNIKIMMKKANILNYRFEAKLLMQHFLQIKPYELATFGERKIEKALKQKIEKALLQRLNGYPLQYILGEWEFYGYPILTGEGVLIPRQDTETLVSSVISLNLDSPRIADLCSGTGCIAIALKKEIKDSEVFAVELSEDALGYLSKNIILNNADVKIIRGDVLDSNITENFIEIDILVSNPPYITDKDILKLQKEVTYEPSMALRGGEDGLEFYREITRIWKNKISDRGYIAYEIGISQEQGVSQILMENGFTDITLVKDLNGIIRVITAKK